MFWKKNENDEWIDETQEELWSDHRRYSVIGGVIVTVVLVIISLVRRADWQITVLVAVSGVVLTAGLWLYFSFELIAAWTGAKLAKLVKKVFKIKDE